MPAIHEIFASTKKLYYFILKTSSYSLKDMRKGAGGGGIREDSLERYPPASQLKTYSYQRLARSFAHRWASGCMQGLFM